MLKLVEVLLPLRKDATDILLDTPIGARFIKFGAQVEQGQIQMPGPAGQGTTVQLKPLVLALLDPEAPSARRRLFLATIGEPVPDGATYIDGFMLPNGALLHLFEIPLLALLPKPAPVVQPVMLQGDV